jgi:hypothetical protein
VGVVYFVYYSSVEYKSNILRLIYAVAGKELHLQLSITSNRSISDDGGKTI